MGIRRTGPGRGSSSLASGSPVRFSAPLADLAYSTEGFQRGPQVVACGLCNSQCGRGSRCFAVCVMAPHGVFQPGGICCPSWGDRYGINKRTKKLRYKAR
ncbi:hypothetical protein CHARACLAT_005042 [Characodon lateralis]|uniref:Uncharacterized protein n=1 Tax=Characodon lateralis TaxID=208331 RepID=A0ABU7F0C4_9TELE|nr:hypothetical protein [Characodon lateralis]